MNDFAWGQANSRGEDYDIPISTYKLTNNKYYT